MSEPRVTITDLAEAAGVSKMTVSRALRGERGIAADTRARIQAVAEKLGYRPDPAISELMGRLRKSRVVGVEPLAWLTTYPKIGGWRDNPGTREMYRGAEEQARQLGYRLEEFSLCTPGMTTRRLSSILYNQAIRGIVLAPLIEHGSIEGFAWEHFATACCGHSLLSPAMHRVSVDQFDVLRTAWTHLLEYGYRKIGLCVSATDNARIGYRWQGAHFIENENFPDVGHVPAMITDDWNAKTFLKWYERNRPDVVLSFADTLGWMKAAGIRVPEDCGFALLRLDHASDVAGVDHRFSDIGAAAVALVVSELSTNHYGIPGVRKSVSIESVWRHGCTLRSRQPETKPKSNSRKRPAL